MLTGMRAIADHGGMTDVKLFAGGRLSTKGVAQILSCSQSFVHSIPKDQLPYTKVGNRRRYLPVDVEFYRVEQARRS